MLLVDDHGHTGAYFADLVLDQNLGADKKPGMWGGSIQSHYSGHAMPCCVGSSILGGNINEKLLQADATSLSPWEAATQRA